MTSEAREHKEVIVVSLDDYESSEIIGIFPLSQYDDAKALYDAYVPPEENDLHVSRRPRIRYYPFGESVVKPNVPSYTVSAYTHDTVHYEYYWSADGTSDEWADLSYVDPSAYSHRHERKPYYRIFVQSPSRARAQLIAEKLAALDIEERFDINFKDTKSIDLFLTNGILPENSND